MKILPLASHQSANVQPRQGSNTTASSGLQRLLFVQSLVEPSGETGLVSGNLLQDILVWQQTLPTHPLEIPLHLLRRVLLAYDLLWARPADDPGPSRGYALPAGTSPVRSSRRPWGGGIMLIVVDRDYPPGSPGGRKEVGDRVREDEYFGGTP